MNRTLRLTAVMVVVLSGLLMACTPINTGGKALVQAPATVDDSKVTEQPTPEPLPPADPEDLPPRPQDAATYKGCFPVYGPDIFNWEAGDPGRESNVNWVFNPESDVINEARIWHLVPGNSYHGYYVTLGTDDGLCHMYQLEFTDGEFAGGASIDAKAWRYLNDVMTFATIVIDTPAGPSDPQIHTV